MPRTSLILILALILVGAALPVVAERGDDTNRASKNGRTEGVVDGVEVVVEFGRPNVKDREIWGGLVPFGTVWRTGADEATTIRFGADVKVEGETLPAGTYGLFTIPGEDGWIILFNGEPNQWGAFNYEEAKDVLRVEVTPRQAEFVESLDFAIDGGEVVLHWEELAVPFAVSSSP